MAKKAELKMLRRDLSRLSKVLEVPGISAKNIRIYSENLINVKGRIDNILEQSGELKEYTSC